MKKVDLGKENINKLLISFAIPCVISMLINSVYNIVDQIFIGKGVGTLGNAATNVIFPLVIIFNAVAGLIGNGASANLSLKLGEGKKEEGGKIIGNAVTIPIISAIVLSVISYLLLPQLVYFFGCTKNVYQYAVDYGRIIILGAPFMIIYSALSQIIRADGAPKYSMILLVVGAILNIILDPIFIFTFNMGVKGGAIATVIGQIVSFVMAIMYLKRVKSVKLTKDSFKLDKSIFRTLGLGLSSFITQITVLALFVFMNNMMTRYGAATKYGADIPLSVYGVISKINSLYISTILGISIGAQPIIGFNYGAGKYDRVKEALRKVLVVNLVVGLVFNIIFYLFPRQMVSIFIANSDPNYKLFLENHANIDSTLKEYQNKISTVIYNLGYLPNGDKNIKTTVDNTILSIKASLKLLNHKGFILIVVYPHEEGKKEATAIKKLDIPSYNINEYHNTNNIDAPYLIEITPSCLNNN